MAACGQPQYAHLRHRKISDSRTWGLHGHSFCEITYVISGELWRSDGARKWKCEPGSFLYHAAKMPHMSWIEPGNKVEVFYLGFLCERIPKGLPVLCKDYRGRVLEILQWLDIDVELQLHGIQDYRDVLLKALLTEFLFLSTHREQPMVRRIRTYVRQHIDEPLLVEKLASVAKMSKYYFARRYRALSGVSPMEDARRVKAREARRLFLHTDLPLKAVAKRVGMGSAQSLCYMLKNQLGMTSRELRGKMFSKAPQIKS